MVGLIIQHQEFQLSVILWIIYYAIQQIKQKLHIYYNLLKYATLPMVQTFWIITKKKNKIFYFAENWSRGLVQLTFSSQRDDIVYKIKSKYQCKTDTSPPTPSVLNLRGWINSEYNITLSSFISKYSHKIIIGTTA